MNVTAGQVMADLARALATRDLAAQNELIERGELPPKYRKSAAQILDEARICVQDTAVATLGGPPGEWDARIALGLAPESIAGPVRAAVSSHAISFAQACALVRDVGAPEVGPEAGQRVCDAVVEYATAKAAATGAPVSQGHFCAKKRREMVKYVSTTRRRTLAMKDRRAWVKPHDDGVASFGVTGADARCLGAYRRVDAIARSRRRQGDPRTLDQFACRRGARSAAVRADRCRRADQGGPSRPGRVAGRSGVGGGVGRLTARTQRRARHRRVRPGRGGDRA